MIGEDREIEKERKKESKRRKRGSVIFVWEHQGKTKGKGKEGKER